MQYASMAAEGAFFEVLVGGFRVDGQELHSSGMSCTALPYGSTGTENRFARLGSRLGGIFFQQPGINDAGYGPTSRFLQGIVEGRDASFAEKHNHG